MTFLASTLVFMCKLIVVMFACLFAAAIAYALFWALWAFVVKIAEGWGVK